MEEKVKFFYVAIIVACLLVASVSCEDPTADTALSPEKSTKIVSVVLPENLRESLLLYYPFSKDNGEKVTDVSGKDRDGKVHGARHVRDKQSDGAMSFDGDDDYITVRNIGVETFTFSAWVKAQLSSRHPHVNDRRIVVLRDGERYFGLEGTSRGSVAAVAYGSELIVEDWRFDFAGESWAHITATYDGNNLIVFWNGEPAATADRKIKGFNGTLTVGGAEIHPDGSSTGFWPGMMDEVAVFDRALTKDEVKLLFDTTRRSRKTARISTETMVSSMSELDHLIKVFDGEQIENQEEQANIQAELARLKPLWRKELSGNHDFANKPHVKDAAYYQTLTTVELAEELLMSKNAGAICAFGEYEQPVYYYHRLQIQHPGYGEWFKREDMWKGILCGYELLTGVLIGDPEKYVIGDTGASLTLTFLTDLYRWSPLREQVNGRERLFMASTSRAVQKWRDCARKIVASNAEMGFWREASVMVQVAMAFARQVDREKYAEIEPAIRGYGWPSDQEPEAMLDFLELAAASLEGFVTEQDYKKLDEILSEASSPRSSSVATGSVGVTWAARTCLWATLGYRSTLVTRGFQLTR